MQSSKGKKSKGTINKAESSTSSNPFSSPAVITAIIGLIGTLVGLYFTYRQSSLPIQIAATQTAEFNQLNASLLSPSTTPTSSSTTEILPTLKPLLIATPQPGQTMILVADLEPLGIDARDISRFMIEDLTQRLSLSFSNFVVHKYPEIISSKEQANEIAQLNQAAIIVWGNYTADFIEVNIQIGDISKFEDIVIKREDIEEAANLRVRIKNERLESIVQGIISSVIVLQTSNSDGYEAIRNLAILETIQASLPESVTPNISSFVAKYCVNYVSNEQEALDNINQALALNGGNSILYVLRGAINQKLGNFETANQDIETALLLGSDKWGSALFLQANNLFFSGNPTGAIAAMDAVLGSNPNDWWSYNVRGSDYLMLGDLSSARADFASAIALAPSANFPYVYSSLISMHEGRLDDAKKFLLRAIQISPDPTYGEKVIYALTGTKVNYPNLDALSSYGRLTLRQYSEAITIAEKGIQVLPFADLFFIKGTAECNLQQYEDAEASYTQGLSLDSEYALLYLLRADVRAKQQNFTGAQSDLTAFQATKQFPLFASYMQGIEEGTLTCETLLTP